MPNLKEQFSRIYDEYIKKIYRFVYLKVDSADIAQDITSEAFIRGWDKFKSGEEVRNIQAFLFQIARNLVIDHYREKSRVRTISNQELQIPDPRMAVAQQSQISSDMAQVKLALAEINEDYQDLIVLRYLDELSIPEIAKVVGKSEGAVRVSLHRGMQDLKKHLENKGF
jgi:RNA polymerase sigma-70 factor (ECF subfamily)